MYVRDALRKWVPEAEFVGVTVQRDGATLALRLRYRVAVGGPREVKLSLSTEAGRP